MKLGKQFKNKRITSTKKQKPLKTKQNKKPEILELNNTRTALKNGEKRASRTNSTKQKKGLVNCKTGHLHSSNDQKEKKKREQKRKKNLKSL